MPSKKASTEEVEKAESHVVKSDFRDINDFHTVHEAGKDVSHFEADRLEKLVELGLVEKK